MFQRKPVENHPLGKGADAQRRGGVAPAERSPSPDTVTTPVLTMKVSGL